MSSKLASKKTSRSGSMEDEEEKYSSTTDEKPRTAGGKIVNRLEGKEQRDSG
jgi:hypothetical protein